MTNVVVQMDVMRATCTPFAMDVLGTPALRGNYITSLFFFIMKYLPEAHRSNVSTAAQTSPSIIVFLLLQNIAAGKVPCNNLIVADDGVILLPYS